MRGNVSGLADFEEDLLSKGPHEAEITKAEIVATNSGGEMLKLEATIQDGPETEQGTSPAGRKVFPQFPHPHPSHKDNGQFAGIQLRKACEAAGVAFDESGYEADDFLGAIVMVHVTHEEYEGEKRERVKKITPA